MKTKIKGNFLQIKTETNIFLAWFPNHYQHSNSIKKEYLEDLKARDKSIIIFEDQKGASFIKETTGFNNGLIWQDKKTKDLKDIILKEFKGIN